MNKTHHIIEFPKRKITRYIPKELAFCDKAEYNTVCSLLYQWNNMEINFEDFRIRAISKLLNVDKKGLSYESLDNLVNASELMDTFFVKQETGYTIKQNYTNNVNSTIRPRFKKLYGPSNEFENITWGQYEDSVNLFMLYNEYPSKELLFRLIATNYLYKNETYNEQKIDSKIQLMELIDFGIVYGFYLLFGSFQKYLSTSEVYWEGKKIDLSIIFSSPKKDRSDIPGLGIKSLTYQLAESGVFGSHEKIRKKNLWEVILRLYDLKKRDLDYEREIKKQQ